MSVLANDGIVLKGTLRYPADYAGDSFPLAVLAHQYPATARSFDPLVSDFLDMGIACLAFDQRGHGASIMGPVGQVVIDSPAGFTLTDSRDAFLSSAARVRFEHVPDDILRATCWGVRQCFVDSGRVLLVGASVGGAGALLVSPRITGLRGVLTLGAAGGHVLRPDGDAQIRSAVQANTAPYFIAASREDPFGAADALKTWCAELSNVTTCLPSGSGHGMTIYFDIRQELLAFARDALRKR